MAGRLQATEVLAVLAALGGPAQDLDTELAKVLAIEAEADEQRQQQKEREAKQPPALNPKPQPRKPR
jgi:hypothetical protein